MKKEFLGVNPHRFHQEMIYAGITPVLVEFEVSKDEYIAEKTWVTFDENVDIDLVNQIVEAHDPTPLPIPLSQEEIINQLQAQVETQNQAIAELTMMLVTPTI